MLLLRELQIANSFMPNDSLNKFTKPPETLDVLGSQVFAVQTQNRLKHLEQSSIDDADE
jgi:hypothetical protein